MMSSNSSLYVWAEAMEILRGSEQLQQRRHFFGAEEDIPCWEPPVDLYEHNGLLRLLVALPGVLANNLSVMLDQGMVVIRGERPLPGAGEFTTLHRVEVPYGRFERTVTLPVGEFRLEGQMLDAGCLVVLIRRAAYE